ncbi:MAG: hypothetical protein ACRD3B_08580 [Candidatus Sulfotelmatobacter sp.]
MNWTPFYKRAGLISVAISAIIFWLACGGNTALKTIDLSPTDFNTGVQPLRGAEGFCFSADNPPLSSFSPGKGEILVGFDDFFKHGADPFPCNLFSSSTFRAGVKFDVSQFDTIVGANFLMDTDSSIERSHGETVSQSPPKSFATKLGLGTQAFTPAFPDDDEVSLPAGPNINIDVSSQVRDWITKARPNFGFVIAGPRLPPDQGSPPEDNKAKVSFYSNFKLRVIYNPAQNPHAPQ